MTLLDLVQSRTLTSTGMTKEDVKTLIYADDKVLHDPFKYDGMSVLVNKLHEFKLRQQSNPRLLLVVDTDYDTDGVMSAGVLAAALSVFNINFRVYIPSMADGYGLNPKAVREMKTLYEVNGFVVDTILTADNGTNAIAGVEEANNLGISVLVTDHHLGGNNYAQADVIVNPNKLMPDGTDEPYPFKGNAGAAVAWKAMTAYAMRYDEESLPLIRDLIVFAGIANVADVMPILDENHYMVKEAVNEIKRLVAIGDMYTSNENPYPDIKNTKYKQYNAVFHGLYDLITLIQKSKDDKKIANNKKPSKLNVDDMIGWYLSPMINAPRRIHATCHEAMVGLLAISPEVRHAQITTMIDMNDRKSELRDSVTTELDWRDLMEHDANVLFVNAPHGISGLIAGRVAGDTGKACMVFSMDTNLPKKIYDDNEFDGRYDKDSLIIGASARSTNAQPLNVIMARIQEIRPDIIVGGGGHAAAAGYSIYYKHLTIFRTLFDKVSKQIENDIAQQMQQLVDSGDYEVPTSNTVLLSYHGGADSAEHAHYNVSENADEFVMDIMNVISFQDQLKPFGKDFNAQTKFKIDLDIAELIKPESALNLDFWKTLKFNFFGVEVLTFDVELADLIKERISEGNHSIIQVGANLAMNSFRGNINPQIKLERL